MKRVMVDAGIVSKLAGLNSSMEFCDSAGGTLGHFVPVADRKRALYDSAKTAFADEEINAAKREPGGVATEELLRRLKAL